MVYEEYHSDCKNNPIEGINDQKWSQQPSIKLNAIWPTAIIGCMGGGGVSTVRLCTGLLSSSTHNDYMVRLCYCHNEKINTIMM